MNAHDETYGVAIGYKDLAFSGRSGRMVAFSLGQRPRDRDHAISGRCGRVRIDMGNGDYLRKSPWMVRMMRRLTLGQNPKFRR